jgi:polyisoprenoid-binding protein YceI
MLRKAAMMKVFGVFAALMALAAAPASAANWNVDQSASKIEFQYMRAGTPTDGMFARFSGSGRFDAADPGAARLSLRIDTTSIDLFDTMASAFATSAEWFDSKNHPNVTYDLTELKAVDETLYEAEGRLTIRGETRPITARINLDVTSEGATASGKLNIVRGDYLLGVGPSAAFVEIGPEVVVSFDLFARPLR